MPTNPRCQLAQAEKRANLIITPASVSVTLYGQFDDYEVEAILTKAFSHTPNEVQKARADHAIFSLACALLLGFSAVLIAAIFGVFQTPDHETIAPPPAPAYINTL